MPTGGDVLAQLVKISISAVKRTGPIEFTATIDLGPRNARGVLADLICGRTALAHSVAEHHVDLGGLIQPHSNLDGEQVPEVASADWEPLSGIPDWRYRCSRFYPCHCSLPILGVDSAEADKVGSQGIRFCAYDGIARDEGMRHCRTTPVRNFFYFSTIGRAVCYCRLRQLPQSGPLPVGTYE